jgi:hypothetical protein
VIFLQAALFQLNALDKLLLISVLPNHDSNFKVSNQSVALQPVLILLAKETTLVLLTLAFIKTALHQT